MVPDHNYVHPSPVATPPPTAQHPTSTMTTTPTTNATVPGLSHGSEVVVDVPPPPPIVRLHICPDGGTGLIWSDGYCFLVFAEPECVYSGDDQCHQADLHFIWDAEHDLTIRKIFDHKMGRQLQQMLDDRIDWLQPEVKKGLLAHWETDVEFRHRHLTNRANRALVRSSKYTRSSTTFMKTKSKSMDHETILADTFKYIYTLKENKAKFADQRSNNSKKMKHIRIL
ncbi:hypothetical protein Ahy_A02g007395 [Arachis hypogaea]|uniref:Uncharacterized protein n=1 Tax=Arachis hypogaea TaxID=3818 RepID=A0A445EC62_ARAHY|nr:hypothetical protein Ahy_A02g007395 [Arachis hypogaea]